jgi:hypothetical protein
MPSALRNIHAELGVRRGTLRQESYNVLKVHIGEVVCTLQLPSQQYEQLKEGGIDPFEVMSTLVERIGKHAV